MSNASTLSVRVERKAVEALDISTFELVATNGGPLPAFSAGSHVDVQLPGGITRQYSLCNDPKETHSYLIGVLRDEASRGGSRAMHDSVQEGTELLISAPKNHFPLAHEARRSLLMAGGIGVTPILCMAERLAISGADFEMHYSTRSLERTAFRQRIQDSAYASRVQFHHDDGDAAQKLDLDTLLATPQEGVHLYVCGPKGYMDAVLGTARARGWPEKQLHFEFFGAEVAASDRDASFEIKLASSGRIVMVPKDKTVAQALAEAGVEIMMSCEQGVCGTCLTRVLEGVPDHKDSYLTPEEQAANDQFTPCCSRAKTPRLVLDL
ncbi:MAG: PDR/VanB family oxidoreductase [Gammaproteobacteria bacterium]|nr:PDR/VanB family oxidoreductase [Gammaproteobacteria bacterium]MBU0787351.1 PDR/VanB family oxidoreductase [Gammaproteobacteria bacterium]MBU0816091.1 PDR/VanB family oxidoreductase [Gammaproteobacteria bacterium]MBU1787630.1 PDR/VanB family oxidoreductase [Gammaproteobacteria bacterium]